MSDHPTPESNVLPDLPSAAMPRSPNTTPRAVRWSLSFIVATFAVLLLYLGRSFFLPLVMALLMQSMLAAGIDRLRGITISGRAIPEWSASVIAMLLLGLVLIGFYSVILNQINVVMDDAPAFLQQAETELLRNASLLGTDFAEGVETALRNFNPRRFLQSLAGAASGLLSAMVLMLLYIGFLMAERPWVKHKIDRLFPDPQRQLTLVTTISDIRRNVHHYLWLKTVINVVIAALTGGMMWMYGLVFVVPVTILTFLFLFIPNLGAIVASLLPLLIAVVQLDSLALALFVFASIGAMQFIIGTIIDPMITGSGLQMSSFAIIVSLTFWSALWGLAGMFLAVPMMVIVMIVCARVPALEPFAILLSKTGALQK